MSRVNDQATGETSFVGGAEGAPSYQLVLQDVSRSFGETRALDGAKLSLQPGEIHSLAGENGSGKSTLIKILSGVLRADSGQILLGGKATRFVDPRAAQSAGISTVYQETLVATEMSVRDNIYFGTDRLFKHEQTKRQEVEGASSALAGLGLPNFDIDRPMWTLSLAERQLVTIARAIVRPWRVLILDEGTSALDANQRDRLFDYLRDASRAGKSILFTSHRMDEVFELAHRITVLRSGKTVAMLEVSNSSEREVLSHMSGRERLEGAVNGGVGAAGLSPISAKPRTDRVRYDEVVLRLEGLGVRSKSEPMTLQLKRGEVLGIAGLEGQGQLELVECLCGLRRPAAGRVVALDDEQRHHEIRSYRDANRHGIRYVPRDRRHEGLFAGLSVFDNFAIASWGELNRFGMLRRKEARRRFREYADYSRLVMGSPKQVISTLSGGNQQKILLGRWISMNPNVLVLNDPLRGVDANTKEELYEFFRRLAGDGMAIVFLSTEILELLVLTDRIAVIHEGNLQALLPTQESTDTEIIAAMFGERLEARNE